MPSSGYGMEKRMARAILIVCLAVGILFLVYGIRLNLQSGYPVPE